MASVGISSLPALLAFTPNSSTSGISYTIPPRLFTSDIQLTLNLCNAPANYLQAGGNTLDTLFTASTNSSFTYSTSDDSGILGGFASLTVPVTSDAQTLTVSLNTGDAPQDYSFELGITAAPDDPFHILEKLPLFAFEDSDNTTALLTSPTYSSAKLSSPPDYDPIITLSAGVREDLSNSTCYIRSLSRADNVATSTTTRGVVELTRAEGGDPDETKEEGRKVQYVVSDLEVASNYTVWGIQPNNVQASPTSGSRLFVRQFFATKRVPNCRLMFDVPFCPDLAYSVPAPPAMSNADLLDLYNSTVAPTLENFNLTLSLFSCDSPLREKQGLYSAVRTCSQCMQAYTSWLCSIRMPRCTDYDSIPSTDPDAIRTFPRTAPVSSRTPDLPSAAFPYSEIPPCIDVCNIVRASCPPLISTPFQCPLKGITMMESYATPFEAQTVFSTIQGGDDTAWFSQSLEEEDFIDRAKNRYGDVKCNDMGVINLVERRRWSGASEVNKPLIGNALRRVPQTSKITVAIFVICIISMSFVISLV